MQVEGQLQLLAEQLEGCNASAAARCAALAAGSDSASSRTEGGQVTVSARRTFTVPYHHDLGERRWLLTIGLRGLSGYKSSTATCESLGELQ